MNAPAVPLAHHFDTPEQQYDASKQGMWIFLLTEVLFFGGLFCLYGVYRSNRPDIFIYAHQFLDKSLGALNTVVLICSSLTMAWAVRCAQLSRRRGLIVCLLLTFLCAAVFLSVKYVEYRHKWEAGLLPGKLYSYTPEKTERAAAVPSEFTGREAASPGAPPRNLRIFFAIYFGMTGLHAIHVLVGMGLMLWLLVGAWRGRYHAGFFTAVDNVGLYWHLVDMIWIYLFPLLYLIR